MIRPLELYSEPFRPTGNLAAEGIANLLGRPVIDPLTLLVREAGQNSWDARLGGTPIAFEIALWNLTKQQHTALARILEATPPHVPLGEFLNSKPVTALSISDRHTTGLGGPLRADVVSEERSDFVDFLRNVGQPPDRQFGGGTFGYGKSVFYLISQVGTILVHTHCHTRGERDARFMGAALGAQYTGPLNGNHVNFTGRHWWGSIATDGVIDPVCGPEADAVAAAIGLPPFETGETGTTVVVLSPTLGDRSPREAIGFIAEAASWNFWPKMMRRRGARQMLISARLDETPVVVPDPEKHTALRGFTRALTTLDTSLDTNEPAGDVSRLTSQRDGLLGHLSLARYPYTPTELPDSAPFTETPHHVALLREPELVVRYLPGPFPPSDAFAYGGVFLANSDLDAAFARAEPPAHDDWLPRILSDHNQRRVVNAALREIKEALDRYVAPPEIDPGIPQQAPLGAFSEYLGRLIPWEAGGGAGLPFPGGSSGRGTGGGSQRGGGSQGGGGRSAVPRSRVFPDGTPTLRLIDELPAAVLRFQVEHADGALATTVEAHVAVLIDDGQASEIDPPAGAERPAVLWWEADDGTKVVGLQLRISPDDPDAWSVAVRLPGETLVGIELVAKAEMD